MYRYPKLTYIMFKDVIMFKILTTVSYFIRIDHPSTRGMTEPFLCFNPGSNGLEYKHHLKVSEPEERSAMSLVKEYHMRLMFATESL